MTTTRQPAAAADKLLAAAKELLAEHRAADVTLRAIAARAGVQHSLIIRHFGSREALLTLAIVDALAGVAAAVGAAPDLPAAVDAAIDGFASSPSLASAVPVLVASPEGPPTDGYPIADALARQLRAAGHDDGPAREAAVAVTVLVAGWSAGEPWWLRMSGHAGDRAAGRRLLERAVWAIIDADADAARV